jgi:hypothetical protein
MRIYFEADGLVNGKEKEKVQVAVELDEKQCAQVIEGVQQKAPFVALDLESITIIRVKKAGEPVISKHKTVVAIGNPPTPGNF